MPVYILHPDSFERLEPVTHHEQLEAVSGKFLYFSPSDTLVIADSTDLYHKDIFLHLQSLSFRGLFPSDSRPTGYGYLKHAFVSSWISQFFGETNAVNREHVQALLDQIT